MNDLQAILDAFKVASQRGENAFLVTYDSTSDEDILWGFGLGCNGVLGPKRRTERLLQSLQAEGMVYSNTQLEKLYAPIGLDIGADTPEALSVSIVAEIQAVLAQRTGGFLKRRSMPIHQ